MKLGIPCATPVVLLASVVPVAAAQLGETPEPQDVLGSALVAGDWNGDGLDDLAIGVPGESITISSTSYARAGAVHVLLGGTGYGGPLGTDGSLFLHQSPATGSLLGIGTNNRYGSALASADFDQDGFADLAIGIPGQEINGFPAAGAVQILRGSPQGLRVNKPLYWTQDTNGVADQAEAGDAFGSSLCTGDFDGDGFDDLAVGAPTESVGSVLKAGAVNVIHGSAVGWLKPKNSFWTQGSGLHDSAEPKDLFGLALAAGDLDGDGFDDLAVGVPYETLVQVRSGVVGIIYGSAVGLTAAGNQLWHQDTPGVEGVAEMNDLFGSALHSTDLDGDGIDDLAIGIPGERTQGIASGGVDILFGAPTGLSAADDLLVTQEYEFLFEELEEGDRFGASLGSWAFDDQLLIGAPGDSVNGVPGEGLVEGVGIGYQRSIGGTILFTTTRPKHPYDGLGSAIASGNFSGNGNLGFAVGIPFLDHEATDSGSVLMIYSYASQQHFEQGN